MKNKLTLVLVLSVGSTFGQNFGTVSSGAFSNQEVSVTSGLIITEQPDQTTSVDEHTFSESVKVYPNPTSDYFTIETESEGEAFLYNTNGSVVTVVKIEPLVKVDLSLYPAGTYILNLVTNQGTKSYKIVKQ